jgi:PcfJ-like protein
MSHSRYSEESRPCAFIAQEIVRGRPWIANHISNNNFRQHCHFLARTFRGSHPLTNPIRDHCIRLLDAVGKKCILLTRIHPADFPVIPVLVRIAAYSQQWIRDPESWPGCEAAVPREILRSLVQHLFAHWNMPACFDNAWLVKGELKYLERDWYCHLASGGSLRQVDGMPPSITSRALHLATTAPANLTIRQALRWGQVRALEGADELMAEVLSSRMVKDLSNDAVWSRLLEKTVAATHFNPRHFGIIADTLLEVIAKEGVRRAMVLVGLPTAELLRHSRRYWKSLLKLARADQFDWKNDDIHCPHLRHELHWRNAVQWPRLPGSKPFEAAYCDGNTFVNCSIVELTQPWQLVAESQAMRHCVNTYVRSCKSGRCSIFSLRTQKTVEKRTVPVSHLTIEVERGSRKIIQVRGRWNQRIAPQKIHILQQWAKEMKLVI